MIMKIENEKDEIEILKHMQEDLSFLKANMVSLKQDVEEISESIKASAARRLYESRH